mmetsp:Transcript_4730/g.8904  ORF Transcript_4730/g.8904 Transcript_4730/m.8904 type:complete len:181 (+) Transcript_4730:90-632(+)
MSRYGLPLVVLVLASTAPQLGVRALGATAEESASRETMENLAMVLNRESAVMGTLAKSLRLELSSENREDRSRLSSSAVSELEVAETLGDTSSELQGFRRQREVRGAEETVGSSGRRRRRAPASPMPQLEDLELQEAFRGGAQLAEPRTASDRSSHQKRHVLSHEEKRLQSLLETSHGWR